ncbi:amidohydrolase family protein [Chloroflexota bacterium]
MKAVDLMCQMVTRWGSILTDEIAHQMEAYLGTKMIYNKTDEEMAQMLRDADVKVMVVTSTGQPPSSMMDIEEVKDIHDRVYQFTKDYSDVIIGSWATISPNYGYKGLRELERCIKDLKFVGYFMTDMVSGVAHNDKSLYNYYDLCSDAGVPVRLLIGHTAGGAGTPGGGGIHLERERPIPYLDDVAADFPNLKVIAGHCSWPWQNELISILLHKANVYAENHGWAPKYVPAELKKEINGRLQDKFMFGSDFPLIPYERCFAEWDAELKPEVAEKMYYKNAQKVFGLEL